MQPDSEVQDSHKKVQDQAITASEGASGGWQGWLTGWYSWYGTDTTDGRAPETTNKNDTSQMFMGEPPTTKGKWNTGNQYTCASSTCKRVALGWAPIQVWTEFMAHCDLLFGF